MQAEEFVLLAVVAYCAGQLASIFVTRGVVAGCVGLLLTATAVAWARLMASLDINCLWSVMPIPAACLAATWMRAPDWIHERNTWRAFLKPAAVLLFPMLVLPPLVAMTRVLEIPKTGPGFAPEEVMRPVTRAETETADLYRQAIAALEKPHATQEQAWLEANPRALDLTLEAASRPGCVLHDPSRPSTPADVRDVQAAGDLARLLLLKAIQLESADELDQALAHYTAAIRLAQHVPSRGDLAQFRVASAVETTVCDRMPHWAAHTMQTPERILAALRVLEELRHGAPTLTETIAVEYIVHRRALERRLAEPSESSVTGQTMADVLVCRFMPWERTRALRLIDVATHELVRRSESICANLEQDGAAQSNEGWTHVDTEGGRSSLDGLSMDWHDPQVNR